MQIIEKFDEKEMKLIRKLANRYPYQNIPELMDLKDKVESTLKIAKFQKKAFKEALRALNYTIRSIGEGGRYYITTNNELWFRHHQLGKNDMICSLDEIDCFTVKSSTIILQTFDVIELGLFGEEPGPVINLEDF